MCLLEISPPLAPQYSKPWPPNILNLPTPMNNQIAQHKLVVLRQLQSKAITHRLPKDNQTRQRTTNAIEIKRQ